MSTSYEIGVRVFDGVERDSSLLIGHDAHRALFGKELAVMLHHLGFTTRKVANANAVSEAELVSRYEDYTAIPFPEGTMVLAEGVAHGAQLYQARLGLEVKPPLDDSTIQKIGPYIATLLHDERRDFTIFDDRGDAQTQELYSKPYSAHIIPFPAR